eukprot:tig00021036_g17319.t1
MALPAFLQAAPRPLPGGAALRLGESAFLAGVGRTGATVGRGARAQFVHTETTSKPSFSVPEGARGAVFVCQSSVCAQRGAAEAQAWFEDALPADARVPVSGARCLGHCDAAPNAVLLAPDGREALVSGCEPERAREALREALGISGDVLLKERRAEEAAAAFSRGLEGAGEAEAGGFPARLRAQLLCGRSEARLRVGDPAGALSDADGAVDALPDWFRGHLRRAEALAAAGEAAGARAAYEACRRAAGGDARVRMHVAASLRQLRE